MAKEYGTLVNEISSSNPERSQVSAGVEVHPETFEPLTTPQISTPSLHDIMIARSSIPMRDRIKSNMMRPVLTPEERDSALGTFASAAGTVPHTVESLANLLPREYSEISSKFGGQSAKDWINETDYQKKFRDALGVKSDPSPLDKLLYEYGGSSIPATRVANLAVKGAGLIPRLGRAILTGSLANAIPAQHPLAAGAVGGALGLGTELGGNALGGLGKVLGDVFAKGKTQATLPYAAEQIADAIKAGGKTTATGFHDALPYYKSALKNTNDLFSAQDAAVEKAGDRLLPFNSFKEGIADKQKDIANLPIQTPTTEEISSYLKKVGQSPSTIRLSQLLDLNKQLNSLYRDAQASGDQVVKGAMKHVVKIFKPEMKKVLDLPGLEEVKQAHEAANLAHQTMVNTYEKLTPAGGGTPVETSLKKYYDLTHTRSGDPRKAGIDYPKNADVGKALDDFMSQAGNRYKSTSDQLATMLGGDHSAAKSIVRNHLFGDTLKKSGLDVNEFLNRVDKMDPEDLQHFFTPEQLNTIRAMQHVKDVFPSSINRVVNWGPGKRSLEDNLLSDVNHKKGIISSAAGLFPKASKSFFANRFVANPEKANDMIKLLSEGQTSKPNALGEALYKSRKTLPALSGPLANSLLSYLADSNQSEY